MATRNPALAASAEELAQLFCDLYNHVTQYGPVRHADEDGRGWRRLEDEIRSARVFAVSAGLVEGHGRLLAPRVFVG